MSATAKTMTVKIRATDRRGKYAPKVYEMEVEVGSQEYLWYHDAAQLYIKDNNHPPYQPGKSYSAYCSRFWFEVVK